MNYQLVKRNERFAFKSTFYGGSAEASGLIDNGNPGPGSHDPKKLEKIPTYLIKKKENDRRQSPEIKVIKQEESHKKLHTDLSPKPGYTF